MVDDNPVAEYPDVRTAAAEASKVAGFTVRRLDTLPPGFVISGLAVRTGLPGAKPHYVMTAVHSASGGLLIEQMNLAMQPDPTGRHITAPKGDVTATQDDSGTSYSIVAGGQAFSLTIPATSTLDQQQALDLLMALVP